MPIPMFLKCYLTTMRSHFYRLPLILFLALMPPTQSYGDSGRADSIAVSNIKVHLAFDAYLLFSVLPTKYNHLLETFSYSSSLLDSEWFQDNKPITDSKDDSTASSHKLLPYGENIINPELSSLSLTEEGDILYLETENNAQLTTNDSALLESFETRRIVQGCVIFADNADNPDKTQNNAESKSESDDSDTDDNSDIDEDVIKKEEHPTLIASLSTLEVCTSTELQDKNDPQPSLKLSYIIVKKDRGKYFDAITAHFKPSSESSSPLIEQGSFSKIFKIVIDEHAYLLKIPHYHAEAPGHTIQDTHDSAHHEVSCLIELNHTHIVQLLASFLYQDLILGEVPILVFAAGCVSLFDLIDTSSDWVQSNSSVLILQITSALKYIHENEYVFGDLKDENIITDQAIVHAYIIDFGCCRKLEHIAKKSTPYLCGSEGWIAPEVVNLTQKVSASSDMYSLSILIMLMINEHKTEIVDEQTKEHPEIFVIIRKSLDFSQYENAGTAAQRIRLAMTCPPTDDSLKKIVSIRGLLKLGAAFCTTECTDSRISAEELVRWVEMYREGKRVSDH